MPVSFDPIYVGNSYDRKELARLWGYQTFHAIAKGVVTPAGTPFIILFITENKQAGSTPYVDALSGNFLHMEGEAAHGSDRRLINSADDGSEVHLFHRKFHHGPFVYEGQVKLTASTLETARPSHFTLTLQARAATKISYLDFTKDVEFSLVAEPPAEPSIIHPPSPKRGTRGETWSYNELLLAFNLYCKTPFGRLHKSNPDVIALAALIGRSVNAVSWKLVNFARLDPALQKRGIKGASHGGKGEIEIWNAFHENWEALSVESETLLAKLQGESIHLKIQGDENISIETELIPPAGIDRMSLVKLRVNQSFFRRTILASYDTTCCITGIRMPELLVASHIVPWAKSEKHRLNPTNGLCLNALHDRAYDRHLLTVTPSHEVLVSERVSEAFTNPEEHILLTRFHGTKITLPKKFQPERSFLQLHYDRFVEKQAA